MSTSWADQPEDEEEEITPDDFYQGTISVNSPSNVATPTAITTFAEMNLPADILKGAYELKYNKPSLIQSHALPIILQRSEHIVAQARSGTGKTAAFGLGVLSLINPADPNTQAICISPTRELAIQNFLNISEMAQFTQIKVVIAIPESPEGYATYASKPAHFIIGTPGLIQREMTNKKINSRTVKYLVFDEAEQVLVDNGLAKTAKKILSGCARGVRVLCFSATFEQEVGKFINNVAPEPRFMLTLSLPDVVVDNIKQISVLCSTNDEKLSTIKSLYEFLLVGNSLIFCNTIVEAQSVHSLLTSLLSQADPNYKGVGILNGDQPKPLRDSTMERFKSGDIRHLVCTNVLSRGIDIPTVALVINYEVPVTRAARSRPKPGQVQQPQVPMKVDWSTYIHRIGRTGRWTKKGIAVTLVHPRDKPHIAAIEKHFGHSIKEIPFENLAEHAMELSEFISEDYQ